MALSSPFAREIGDHVLEVAGLHGFFHVALRLLDPFVGDFQRDVGRPDLLGMLVPLNSLV